MKKKLLLTTIFAILAFSLMGFLPICGGGSYNPPPTGTERDEAYLDGLEVHFFDVGQADAALVTFPGGETMLIDAGRWNLTHNAFRQDLLAHFGSRQRRLNYFITTHSHADHIGSAAWVVNNFYVQNIIRPTSFSTSEIAYGVYMDFGISPGQAREQTSATMTSFANAMEDSFWINGMPTNIRLPYAGKSFNIGRNDTQATITFYSPTSTNYGGSYSPNEYSTIFCIYFNGRRIMFTGDAYQVNENRILHTLPTSVCVLDLAHHGSDTSSGGAFLDRINPHIAIAQVGTSATGNTFGHPHNAVLSRLSSRNITLYRTDLHGAITVQICRTGENLRVI